jgi:hypothetical protein
MAELLSLSSIVPGTVIEFDYPTHNFHHLNLEFVRRAVQVERMESFLRSPLSLEALRRRPLIRRGSTMVFGRDLLADQERSFYLEASRGAFLPGFQLGIYDPESLEDSLEVVSCRFKPTERNCWRMLAMMTELAKKDYGRLKLGAFRCLP